jgi:hypothetical protein
MIEINDRTNLYARGQLRQRRRGVFPPSPVPAIILRVNIRQHGGESTCICKYSCKLTVPFVGCDGSIFIFIFIFLVTPDTNPRMPQMRTQHNPHARTCLIGETTCAGKPLRPPCLDAAPELILRRMLNRRISY